MRKKMLIFMMAAVIGISGTSVSMVSAGTANKMSQEDEDEYDDEADEDDGDEADDDGDDDDAYELTKDDLVVKPAKKTIKVKNSFTINVRPSEDIVDEYADLPKEEWRELLEQNIDGITYRSSRSAVASVNRQGKVKGKKRGSAVIKTTITFRDGSEGSYKTKVYVTR